MPTVTHHATRHGQYVVTCGSGAVKKSSTEWAAVTCKTCLRTYETEQALKRAYSAEVIARHREYSAAMKLLEEKRAANPNYDLERFNG